MASNHIEHTRRVIEYTSSTLGSIIPPGLYYGNFAAFFGSNFQRYGVALPLIRRVLGVEGVVVIHNDPMLDTYLYNGLFDSGHRTLFVNNPGINGEKSPLYDPLYGLNHKNAVDALMPSQNPPSHITQDLELQGIIEDYLLIMEYFSVVRPEVFGESQYNLDLLYDLCAMPYETLKNEVLDYIQAGSKLMKGFTGRISEPKAQQNAFRLVSNFSNGLSETIWTKRDFGKHTRLSIIDTVNKKGLISINVANSNGNILDYLSVELRQLNEAKTKYLLIVDNIALRSNENFRSLVLESHPNLNYHTGILDDNANEYVVMASGVPSLSNLTDRFGDIFVFSCSSADAAQPFSNATSSYHRNITETSSGNTTRAFKLLSDYSNGYAVHETAENNIRPSEFVGIENGCILLGYNHKIPKKINYLDLQK